MDKSVIYWASINESLNNINIETTFRNEYIENISNINIKNYVYIEYSDENSIINLLDVNPKQNTIL